MATRSVLASGPGGKDIVMVATREELSTPSKVTLPEPEPTPGLIMPDGSINWGCPCLGGMATGPCGLQFRDAFSCFHYRSAPLPLYANANLSKFKTKHTFSVKPTHDKNNIVTKSLIIIRGQLICSLTMECALVLKKICKRLSQV